MSINLLCLTSAGGLPIFSKKKGDCENLPFSTIGSLNGVHMFCKSQGVNLKTTELNDGIVVWRDYEESIMLIVTAKGVTTKVLESLLDLTFNAMIFSVGLNQLQSCHNIERLKRDLKNSHPIIEKLLDTIDSDLFKYTESILCPENGNILEKLNSFGEQLGSPFCCVFIRQKIAAATEGWWNLDVTDRKLLMTTLSISNNQQKDVAVYLPEKSPNIAYRLVSIPLIPNVSVCILCGAEPSFSQIENVAQQIWRNDLEILLSADQCYPRNFPSNLELDPGILGILLINKLHRKYVISRNIQSTNSGQRSGTHRLDILRTFFHQAVDLVEDFVDLTQTDEENNKKIKNLENYWCSDYHKCHALRRDENLICILYTAAIPTHTMRLITQKTLNTILSEKEICW